MIEETGDYMIVQQEYEQMVQALAKERTKQMDKVNSLALQMEKAFNDATKAKNRTLKHTRMSKFEDIRKAWVVESMKIGIYMGAGQESHLLMTKLDQLVRMAGGEKSKEIMEAAVLEKVAV